MRQAHRKWCHQNNSKRAEENDCRHLRRVSLRGRWRNKNPSQKMRQRWGRDCNRKKRLCSFGYIAYDEPRTLETCSKFCFVHRIESCLPHIRYVPKVTRLRQTCTRIQSKDLHLDPQFTCDLRRILLKRDDSVAAGDSKFDSTYPSVAEALCRKGTIVQAE